MSKTRFDYFIALVNKELLFSLSFSCCLLSLSYFVGLRRLSSPVSSPRCQVTSGLTWPTQPLENTVSQTTPASSSSPSGGEDNHVSELLVSSCGLVGVPACVYARGLCGLCAVSIL